MRMRDVFGPEPVLSFELFVLETDEKQDAAAHAINCHDELVEALEGLQGFFVEIHEIVPSAILDSARDILKKAKGE